MVRARPDGTAPFWLCRAGFGGWRAVGRGPAESAVSRAMERSGRNPACRIGRLVGHLAGGRNRRGGPVGGDMNRIRTPSPALVIACLALFVALERRRVRGGDDRLEDIINGSIRNRDFKDGTLRGNEAKRNGFGGGAIKESSLAAGELGKVNSAARPTASARHGVISKPARSSRGRGIDLGQQDRRRPVPGGLRRRRDALHLLRDARRRIGRRRPAHRPDRGELRSRQRQRRTRGRRATAPGVAADRPFHLIVSC